VAEVNGFNNRTDGGASTVKAAFVYYGVIIAHFYDISATPGCAALLPNREIHLEGPRLIGP